MMPHGPRIPFVRDLRARTRTLAALALAGMALFGVATMRCETPKTPPTASMTASRPSTPTLVPPSLPLPPIALPSPAPSPIVAPAPKHARRRVALAPRSVAAIDTVIALPETQPAVEAPTVEAPTVEAPTVEAPTNDVVTSLYVRVGSELHVRSGTIEVSDLWTRYRMIQLYPSLATVGARTAAAEDLRSIDRAIQDRVQQRQPTP